MKKFFSLVIILLSLCLQMGAQTSASVEAGDWKTLTWNFTALFDLDTFQFVLVHTQVRSILMT